MAKTMVKITDGIVTNMLWCSESQANTATIIDTDDRTVGIGDTYDGTDFYRDGIRILTPLEEALAEIERLKDDNAAKEAAYREGVASA